jgi:hypothetical protein
MRMALVGGLVLATLPFSAAPASAEVDAYYECENVTIHTIFPNTPLNAYPCSGPIGTSPGGIVIDVPNNTGYYCTSLTGSLINGAVYVFGNICG